MYLPSDYRYHLEFFKFSNVQLSICKAIDGFWLMFTLWFVAIDLTLLDCELILKHVYSMFLNIMLLDTASSAECMHVNGMYGTQIDVYVLPPGVFFLICISA